MLTPVTLPPGRANERTKPAATISPDEADDGNRPGRLLCGAHRGITDAKDNVRGGLGQRRRDFRRLIIAKIKATGNDLQVLPLNEAEPLEFVKKRYDPWCLTTSAGYHAESVDASGLLRSRDRHPKQRHCRRTSDEGDEFPPRHVLPPQAGDYTPPQLKERCVVRHSKIGVR